jgi:1-acyl-sn-glycerol-3-phosphate acyltransferase
LTLTTEPSGQAATATRLDSSRSEISFELLRWLWAPWTYLVYIPYLAISTLVFGIIAVFITVFSARLAFHMGTLWAWLLCVLNFTWVSVRGREHMRPGQSYVIMCNHQSQFDILSFYGHWRRQFRWVMKEELKKVPGLGWYCAAGGHVFIDRSNREKAIESLNRARPLLTNGISVVFFPEGTRSNDGRLLPFKKGGFIMAQDLGLPILPVSISGSRHVLPNRTLKLLPGRIRIRIHEPIDVSQHTEEDRDRLVAKTRARISSGLTQWEQGDDQAVSSS